MSTLHDDFAELFQGNPTAHGTVEGGCVRTPPPWRAHLERAGSSIGIYPMVESAELRQEFQVAHDVDGGAWYVRWGCTDIDNKANPEACWPLAVNLVKALKALGIRGWIERTKGKGYHVWVFSLEWIPAIVMRRALLAAHQVAGVAPTEVNPKQVDTTGIKAGLGNYVNLPYAADWAGTDRRTIVTLEDQLGSFFADGEPMAISHFLEEAFANAATFQTLVSAAKLYKPPPKVEAVAYDEPTVEAAALAERLGGLAFTIWKKGVLEGRDRSGTLQRLAHLMCEGGMTPGETLVLLRDADCRWGKFFDRIDGEEQLQKMVQAAHTKQR